MSNNQTTSWRDVMGSKYFTARFLDDEFDQVVKIENAEVKEIDKGEPKIVLHFRGWERPLIMNISNCYYTEWALQTDDYIQWIGKEICLYKDTATYEGEERETVRVRPFDMKIGSSNNEKAHAEELLKYEEVGRDIFGKNWDNRKAVMVSNYMMSTAGVEGITQPEKLGIKPLTELTDMMLEKATKPNNQDNK